MRVFGIWTAAVMIACAAPAVAGPFTEAEAELRQAYGSYRAALFLSNQGKGAETAEALKTFEARWSGIVENWSAAAPPQYADDPALADTFAAVDGLIEKASSEVATNNLSEAHETLEGVRDEIGALHLRNGLMGFSDRMNAYHAAMEHVLSRDYTALGEATLRIAGGDAALLDYLAGEIVIHPVPEADAPEFEQLILGFLRSVSTFKAAVESGDAAAIIEAQGQLKVPYSKLFAKFG